jgi:hypothetical protein
MTDRERLVEIIKRYSRNSTGDYHCWVREPELADAILAAGFGDVVQCTEDYEREVFKLNKRIAELEAIIKKHNLGDGFNATFSKAA